MRHQDHGRFLFTIQRQQQIQHMLPVSAIQVSRRLIGHQNGRFGDKGARQRHSLLLPA